MSRWFRVDDGLVDDPKVQQLPPALIVAMLNLWCVTSQCGGNLPPIAQVAFKLRLTVPKARKVIDDLKSHGLIDEDEAGTRPHNWNARQFKTDVTDPTNAERQKRFRGRDKSVTPTVTETVTVTDTRAETEQRQNRAETDIAPDGATTNGKSYAFESGIIRLASKDLAKWQKAFTYLDLAAELTGLTKWAGEQGPENWFFAVSGALAKRNRDEKMRREKPAVVRGNPLFEGIT